MVFYDLFFALTYEKLSSLLLAYHFTCTSFTLKTHNDQISIQFQFVNRRARASLYKCSETSYKSERKHIPSNIECSNSSIQLLQNNRTTHIFNCLKVVPIARTLTHYVTAHSYISNVQIWQDSSTLPYNHFLIEGMNRERHCMAI